MDKELPKHIKDLVESLNIHSRYSNQLWVALIVAAAVIVFPRIKDGFVELPFSLGAVDNATFGPVGFLILAALTIAYCQAYAQALITIGLGHKLLDSLDPAHRRLFDLAIVPTLVRVAPLVELFRSRGHGAGHHRDLAAAGYYILLKFLAFTVALVIPAIALISAYHRLVNSVSGQSGFVASAAIILAGIVLLVAILAVGQIVWAEAKYIGKAVRRHWLREKQDA